MSGKSVGYKDAKWVAFDCADYEHELFGTYEDAEAWLKDLSDEGIAEETIEGMSYIAKITHRSAVDITDKKEDYHKHTENCPEDCDEDEWPYDSDFDWVGTVYMKQVEDNDFDTLHSEIARLKAERDEYRGALELCVSALYEAIEIAPLDRFPGKAGGAIQQSQYVLNRYGLYKALAGRKGE